MNCKEHCTVLPGLLSSIIPDLVLDMVNDSYYRQLVKRFSERVDA